MDRARQIEAARRALAARAGQPPEVRRCLTRLAEVYAASVGLTVADLETPPGGHGYATLPFGGPARERRAPTCLPPR